MASRKPLGKTMTSRGCWGIYDPRKGIQPYLIRSSQAITIANFIGLFPGDWEEYRAKGFRCVKVIVLYKRPCRSKKNDR